MEALQPHSRIDKGCCRRLDSETEQGLLQLRKEMPNISLPVFLTVARDRHILPPGTVASVQTLYRLFHRHGVPRVPRLLEDRRRFETELPNDLWQSDCLHGPKVSHEGRLRQSYLFAMIDDHSRLIPHAQFYLAENLESFRDCLIQALVKRGLPRRFYVDNSSVFRCHTLKYACARLGIVLLYTAPYTPEGKGKIERWFKTLRTQFLPLLPPSLSLAQLNEHLAKWINEHYHLRAHSSTGQTPLQRYLIHIVLLRKAPADLHDYFRTLVRRKVDKDRTISLAGKLYEAPLGLIGNTVTLLYHPQDPSRIEVFFEERSWGFLVPLSVAINSRVKRISGQHTELIPPSSPPQEPPRRGGQLFERSSET